MFETKERVDEALKSYFGFEKFKGNQKEIIESVLNGKDTFVICLLYTSDAADE